MDDTPVPVLAKGKTRTGRLWTMVRDDRPFGGADPPAAAYFYSPDRSGEHAEVFLAGFSGIMQADACAGHVGIPLICIKGPSLRGSTHLRFGIAVCARRIKPDTCVGMPLPTEW